MPKKVLLIENDYEMREIMRSALQQDGYDVTTAEDGVNGYDLSLFLRPDLIITDIGLPGADGVHVLRRVRDTPAIAKTPVLVITAFGTGSATFALQLGANGFEPKPIDAHSFICSVRRLLRRRKPKKAA